MIKKWIFSLLSGLLCAGMAGFSPDPGEGEFTDVINLPVTPVKSQGNTGTCWSFATTSFLEAEILRKGKGRFDLSEMFFVYYAYKNKATRYLLYHGNNTFSQGGQAHDVLDVVRNHGIVPDQAFPGKQVKGKFQHRELILALHEAVKESNQQKNNFDASETKKLNLLLEEHLGKIPEQFTMNGERYTPEMFRDSLGIDANDYIELTSYIHHPFYSAFVLELPDNWSHNLYYNVPVDELMQIITHSLKEGYTFCWDGDTSERTFRHKKGYADLPRENSGEISQKRRQETFYNRETTDDHMMHITGMAKDPDGRIFFKTKNSWGPKSNNMGGFLYLSEDYVRLKTIAVLVHRNAIPEPIAKKLFPRERF
jgi:bleomycin hydrolase